MMHVAEDFNIAVQFKYLNDEVNDNEHVGEFNILFRKDDSSLDKLLEFVDVYSDRRVNIRFTSLDLPVARAAHKVSDKVSVILPPEACVGDSIPKLREAGVPYFFDSNLPAYNYCMLSSLVSLGVSDVYIADDLCYNVENVHAYCKSHGVGVRAIVNKIPMTTPDKGSNDKDVVFLPRDIAYLKDYIDTFELDCGEPCDWAKFDVLYRTFFDRARWGGEIGEFNDDVHMKYNDDQILPYLAMARYKCGRKCDMRENPGCDKCRLYMDMQRLLDEKGARFVAE